MSADCAKSPFLFCVRLLLMLYNLLLLQRGVKNQFSVAENLLSFSSGIFLYWPAGAVHFLTTRIRSIHTAFSSFESLT